MAAYKRTDYTFTSLGETCAADFYVPVGIEGPWPAVITGPGFAGVKEMLIPSYARSLASAGIACLSVDFIGFGASGGGVRQDIRPFEQIRTLRDGLDCLEKDERCDRERLGVWGTSLGGAHALVLAAGDERVKAVVALIPHISVAAPGVVQRVGLGIPLVWDLVWRSLGYKHATMAVTGTPGERAVMTTDGAMEWIGEVTKEAPRYRNEVTLASLLQMVAYDTKPYARRVKCPLLAISAVEDGITPASKIHDALEGMANVEFVDFEGSHFGLFGESLGETVRLTTEFLVKHL